MGNKQVIFVQIDLLKQGSENIVEIVVFHVNKYLIPFWTVVKLVPAPLFKFCLYGLFSRYGFLAGMTETQPQQINSHNLGMFPRVKWTAPDPKI